jgi:malonyl-CoA decarboxylase
MEHRQDRGKDRAGGGRHSFIDDLLQQLFRRGRPNISKAAWTTIVQKGESPPDLVELGEALLSRRGEASGVLLARALLEGYQQATPEARRAFLLALAERFGPDAGRVEQVLGSIAGGMEPVQLARLHDAAEPRRQELFRRLNLAKGGTAALVKIREELLRLTSEAPALRQVDDDFHHLFSSWFNRGFLTVRQIDWNTPASILEKIIRYEAVHAIRDWDDLRNRLQPEDRRCYGFFHPQIEDEPLIFVEVALTKDTPAAIAPLLDLSREVLSAGRATTAVFYSISNTQRGLAGISFGNFLIKQVVEILQRELPDIRRFVTLSPVPGFADWLRRAAEEHSPLAEEARRAHALMAGPGWDGNAAGLDEARALLEPLAAYYLAEAKNRRGQPVDPVARFHLSNGARLERVNFLGDRSPNALRQAHGFMVNYLYVLADIEKNHEALVENGIAAISDSVRALVRGLPQDRNNL